MGREDLTAQEEALLKLLKTTQSEEDLTSKLGVDKGTLYQIAHGLNAKGYRVGVDRENKQLLLEKDAGEYPLAIGIERVLNHYRIAIGAEPRLGHVKEQPRMLHTIYEVLGKNLKPDVIIIGGLTAGKETPSHKGEIHKRSHLAQRDYAVKRFPQAPPRRKTYVVGGQRDLSWVRGIGYDIISAICAERADLVHAGYEERDFRFGNAIIKVMAVGDDVTQRSGRSYQPQRRADEIVGEKPDILVTCGWHSEVYLPDYKGMCVFSVGSLHAQTMKQRKKGIAVLNNILILDIELDPETKRLKSVEPVWIPLEHLLHSYDYLAGPEILERCTLEGLPRQILELLIERKASSRGGLKRHFKINNETLDAAIEEVKKCCRKLKIEFSYKEDTKEFTVSLPLRQWFGAIPGEAEKLFGKRVVKWVAISDTHLNEKEQQPTILRESYRIAEREEAEFITHSGDLTGGTGAAGYRGHQFDVIHQGVDDAEDYIAEIYPKATRRYPSGATRLIKTYAIGGHHDNAVWDKIGHLIIRGLQLRRKDIVSLGRVFGFLRIKGLLIKLLHPDGGIGRSLTYQLEKHVTTFKEECSDEPLELVLINGHYHVPVYERLPGVRAHVVPCQKKTDVYHQKKGLSPRVGIWLLTARFDTTGKWISMYTTRYISFQHLVKEKDY